MSAAIQPGINFGIIGLGQCGGNLTEEFYLRGYPGITLNTSYTDLRAGRLPAVKRFHIGARDLDGAGQNMVLGGRYLRANSKRILETVERELGAAEVFLLTGGLSGGTGGNLGILAEIIAELDKPICALAALPMNSEGAVRKINAVKGLEALLSSPVNSVTLIDNQKIMTLYRDAPLAEMFSRANGCVVSIFDCINRITRHPGLAPVRNFDSEDLRKFFLSRGMLLFWEIKLDDGDLEGSEALLLRLREAWGQEGLLCAGFDFSAATMAAVILLAPKSSLKDISLTEFDNLSSGVKELVSSAGLYSGIFRTSDDENPRILTMAAGLPLPDRVNELLESAKSEGKMLSMKFSEAPVDFDTQGLSEIDLLSSVRPAPRLVKVNEQSADNGGTTGFKIKPWNKE